MAGQKRELNYGITVYIEPSNCLEKEEMYRSYKPAIDIIDPTSAVNLLPGSN